MAKSNFGGPRLNLETSSTLADLINGRGFHFNIDLGEEMPEDAVSYQPFEVIDNLCPETLGGPCDEDTYDESQPFEMLAQKMGNIVENGKVKKRILREGLGIIIPALSKVTVNYNFYLEYNDEPFDSTYIRKRPFTFTLSSGQTLAGLDIAVATMKPNEKAQFLVHPDYGYGKFGCPDRIPPNAQILMEVELISFCNSGATSTYQTLDEELQKNFEEIYKYAHGLCSKGNEYFKKRNHKLAIREYNMAIGKLECCELRDYEDQEKQQKLLLRLYSNNAVAYSMLNEPRKCCTYCNKVFYLAKGTSLIVSAKVYFHNARALMNLGDFGQARKQLSIARKIEPNNEEIAQEFKVLEEKYAAALDREKEMAKTFISLRVSEPKKLKVSDEFKKVIDELMQELIDDQSINDFKLPPKLTGDEKECIEIKAKEKGLFIKEESGEMFVCKI